MAEIKFQDLDQYLIKLSKNDIPCVFLIYGERYLIQKAFDCVLDFIIPKDKRQLGYQSLEGDDANIPEIIERISTYSMMQNRLVIAVKDAPLFPGHGTPMAYGFSKQNIDNLQKLIERGVPSHHHLILTSSSADKRRGVFKAIKNRGAAIDCTMPHGSSRADQNQQIRLLREIMHNILNKTNKSINNDAYKLLIEKTGFDTSVFADNIEKLASFTGNRKEINVKDVSSLVKRTKQDPVFELTNAFAQKNTEKTLFYNRSLLNAGFHPLQILAAMTNQTRKLILAKNFIEKSRQTGQDIWKKGKNYNQFQQVIMPEIIKADKSLMKKIAAWNDNEAKNNKSSGKKTKNNFKDILIASNPKSAYPVYQTFLRSDNFSMQELAETLIALGELDFTLKSSSGAPDILIENLIMKVCK